MTNYRTLSLSAFVANSGASLSSCFSASVSNPFTWTFKYHIRLILRVRNIEMVENRVKVRVEVRVKGRLRVKVEVIVEVRVRVGVSSEIELSVRIRVRVGTRIRWGMKG